MYQYTQTRTIFVFLKNFLFKIFYHKSNKQNKQAYLNARYNDAKCMREGEENYVKEITPMFSRKNSNQRPSNNFVKRSAF